MPRWIKDEKLQSKLTPDYPLGCKRVLVSDDFYPALAEPNVTVTTDKIDRVSPSGVRVQTPSGPKDFEIDVLVLATGFRTREFLLHLDDIQVRNKQRLADVWDKTGATAYFGLAHPDMPNLFMIYGG